jgi:hypothetical protein
VADWVPGLIIETLLRQDALGGWWRARGPNGPCTVRAVRDDFVGRDDARGLFAEEVRRISTLDHPALLKVERFDVRGPRPWMVTQPIDGPTLASAVGHGGPMGLEDALAVARHVTEGLGVLEARRQFHASPYPSHLVLVGPTWRLLTFREVRAFDEAPGLKGKKLAEPPYAPPETDAADRAPVGPLALTAWAVGSILRFASGGGPPRGPDGAAAALPAGFPARLKDVLGRLLHPSPMARPQGAAAVLEALGTPA